jgi:hypothetical protein
MPPVLTRRTSHKTAFFNNTWIYTVYSDRSSRDIVLWGDYTAGVSIAIATRAPYLTSDETQKHSRDTECVTLWPKHCYRNTRELKLTALNENCADLQGEVAMTHARSSSAGKVAHAPFVSTFVPIWNEYDSWLLCTETIGRDYALLTD